MASSQDDGEWRVQVFIDCIELEWWRHFRTKCFNDVPVGRPLLGDRFKIMVQNPFDDTWEDVWTPKSRPQSVDSPIAETPQLDQEPSGERSGLPPTVANPLPTEKKLTGS